MTSLQQQPLHQCPGIGPKIAEYCHSLGIQHVQDALFHMPLRYENRTSIQTIRQLPPAAWGLIDITIIKSHIVYQPKRRLVVEAYDDSGHIQLVFFHFNQFQQQHMQKVGQQLHCYGQIRLSRQGKQMIHPEYTLYSTTPPALPKHLTAVYPTTKGLSQRILRQLINFGLQQLKDSQALPDFLPQDIITQHGFPALHDALCIIHQPNAQTNISQLLEGTHPAQQRLALEELIAHRLHLQSWRATKQQHTAAIIQNSQLADHLLQQLPFQPTQAQLRIMGELADDLKKGQPMLRLVQGDVGCGKTLLAIYAMCLTAAEQWQCAFMAPTELLAEQHFQQCCAWLEPLKLKVVFLSSQLKTAQRREALQAIANGSADIIVGTHALFQKDVLFAKLALVIIDEQHRFGVHQRLALRHKAGSDQGYAPHQLIMTATPIPRTLAMTAYNHLDCSIVDELPPGRKTIQTSLLSQHKRDQLIDRLKIQISQGAQVYWVCPLIEESEALIAEATTLTAEYLQQALPDLSIGLVHGRQSAQEKHQAMQQFKQQQLHILVATTVIEVGVDVPNATIMVIDNAERLGLAQLHQLRGRVGRGAVQSYCILLYKEPLGHIAQQRLKIMQQQHDGFIIAQHDLQMRGPGDVLGSRQAGLLLFRIADIIRDETLIQLSDQIIKQLPSHFNHHHQLIQRWINTNQQLLQA